MNIYLDELFIVNRVVDAVFIIDIILTFFVMYKDQYYRNVRNHKKIRERYLKGWFYADLLSTFSRCASSI